MAVTRAKATALLNKTEMGLYDDSRANALRDHSDARLTQLVSRARTARDRARDLEKRQRLASRKTSGSKSGRTGLANARTGEKAELLADILSRLETRQRDAAKAAKASARTKTAKTAASNRAPAKAAKAAAKTTKSKTASTKTAKAAKTSKPAKKVAAKKAAPSAAAAKSTPKAAKKTAKAAKKTTKAAKPSAASTQAAKKPVARTAAAKKTARKPAAKPDATAKPARRSAAKATQVKAPAAKAGKKAAGRGKRGITPEQALENTRKLLAQHEAEAKASKPWETLGTESAAVDAPGYQSPQARSKALALHEAETRQAPINGSISTRDRRNQRKRDHQGGEG